MQQSAVFYRHRKDAVIAIPTLVSYKEIWTAYHVVDTLSALAELLEK